MKNIKTVFVCLFIILFPLIFSTPSFAASSCGGVDTILIDCESQNGSTSIPEIALKVVDIISILVGIAGVIGISIFGIQFLTSKDNAEQANKAKNRLFQLIIGLVLFALANPLIHWLFPNPTLEIDPSTTTSEQIDKKVADGVPLKSNYRNKTVTINGKKYRYDANGNLVFGEKKIGKYTYYFNEKTGVMKQKGFQKINSKTYYFDKKGHKVYGQYFIKKKAYYFDKKTGAMYEGKLYFGVPLSHYKSIKRLTPQMIVDRAKEVVDYVRKTKKFSYCDSQSYPPGKDHCISCERLVSIILYSYGFTNQPRSGGYKIANGFIDWMRRLGFKESNSLSAIKKGSIVWLRWTENDDGVGHVFVVDSWKNDQFKRYDTGSEDRFNNINQPVVNNGFPYNIVGNNLIVFNL